MIGIPFTIRTDCNSLKLLASKKDLSPRIGRWFVKLPEYTYTIEYQKGENNTVADALSRHPVEEAKEMELTGLPMLGITITTDWVAAIQRASDEIMTIRDKLERGDAKTHEKFTMLDARVYRTTKGRMRLYVPEELRYEIVSEYVPYGHRQNNVSVERNILFP